jgi:hypothetical protein
MLRRHQPLDRNRAQVDDQEIGLILERFRRRLIDRCPVPSCRPRNTVSRTGASARASANPNNACGSLALRSTTSSPPIR